MWRSTSFETLFDSIHSAAVTAADMDVRISLLTRRAAIYAPVLPGPIQQFRTTMPRLRVATNSDTPDETVCSLNEDLQVLERAFSTQAARSKATVDILAVDLIVRWEGFLRRVEAMHRMLEQWLREHRHDAIGTDDRAAPPCAEFDQ